MDIRGKTNVIIKTKNDVMETIIDRNNKSCYYNQ